MRGDRTRGADQQVPCPMPLADLAGCSAPSAAGTNPQRFSRRWYCRQSIACTRPTCASPQPPCVSLPPCAPALQQPHASWPHAPAGSTWGQRRHSAGPPRVGCTATLWHLPAIRQQHEVPKQCSTQTCQTVACMLLSTASQLLWQVSSMHPDLLVPDTPPAAARLPAGDLHAPTCCARAFASSLACRASAAAFIRSAFSCSRPLAPDAPDCCAAGLGPGLCSRAAQPAGCLVTVAAAGGGRQ